MHLWAPMKVRPATTINFEIEKTIGKIAFLPVDLKATNLRVRKLFLNYLLQKMI